MAFCLHWNKKQLLKILIFLSGFGFLSLQIWQTFQIFIEQRSTVILSKEYFDSLAPPTIIFCLSNRWNISLNEEFNLTLKMKQAHQSTIQKLLTIGENFDDQKKLITTVEELVSPSVGLCYALLFNENNRMVKMGIEDSCGLSSLGFLKYPGKFTWVNLLW